jgi:hypothetical protein
MIKYRLKCGSGHDFESWFSSSEDFDRLAAGKLLSCAVCGSAEVEKALMAPGVASSDGAGEDRPLSRPASLAEQALRALREKIEREAENVGPRFAEEARRIHAGEAPERAIYGEARPAEARQLVEDGIPVTPLPWRKGKQN